VCRRNIYQWDFLVFLDYSSALSFSYNINKTPTAIIGMSEIFRVAYSIVAPMVRADMLGAL